MDPSRILGCKKFFKMLVIRIVFHKIDIFSVHQQDWNLLIFAEVSQIFFLNVSQVFNRDVLFEGAIPFRDLFQQSVGFGVKV